MTTFVVDDLIQGAVKYLGAQGDVLELLGSYTDGVPWLFQHTLWVTVEGSQRTAAVVSRAEGWAGPNQYNTMRFPRISLELYADPLRDAGNNITDPGEVQRRIEATYQLIDSHLHRPQGGVQMWGTVRTIGCTRLAEPSAYPVPDGGGLVRLQVFYGVTQA